MRLRPRDTLQREREYVYCEWIDRTKTTAKIDKCEQGQLTICVLSDNEVVTTLRCSRCGRWWRATEQSMSV